MKRARCDWLPYGIAALVTTGYFLFVYIITIKPPDDAHAQVINILLGNAGPALMLALQYCFEKARHKINGG